MTSSSPPRTTKNWWQSNRKIAAKYVEDSRALMATGELSNASSALSLLESALALHPLSEAALELKARCLLRLRRFRDVAELLRDHIPSFQASSQASKSSSSTSPSPDTSKIRCFSFLELRKKVAAGHWRYTVLGQACFHLGMLEDAMALLQTGRRLAAAASRRESRRRSDDKLPFSDPSSSPSSLAPAELAHIRFLLRRRAAALAALAAGHPGESLRHFSKILDGRRGTPCAFAAGCLLGRAAAHGAAARTAEALADCNRALALDPSSIPALRLRADLLEGAGCLAECLRDLDHLKLLYGASFHRGELAAGELEALAARIQALRRRAGGAAGAADNHMLMGVRRGCSRQELERAHRLLSLRNRPERAAAFVDRVEFAGEHRDLESVREQARMSAMLLCRQLQKAYASIMAEVMAEEQAEAGRKQQQLDAAVAATEREDGVGCGGFTENEAERRTPPEFGIVGRVPLPETKAAAAAAVVASVFQGVFCRDLAIVGNLLSQAAVNRTIPVKYEALSC
ncbi:unnamed protein product [Spirodela intermedia]|uniref:Uncharacterized protein n=1 Tax=Spirodela intermedia TaxID=51605 RepID=A0A7I8KSG4_SPIIN|nr:unnamed protein product [Spirodela intermedia]